MMPSSTAPSRATPGPASKRNDNLRYIVVEIAGAGQVAVDGLEMPTNQQRYALSQQMIVLDIQRLRARERRLSRAVSKKRPIDRHPATRRSRNLFSSWADRSRTTQPTRSN